MSTTTFGFLFRVEAPWIYVGPGEPSRMEWNPSHFYSCDNMAVCVRQLRGWKMKHTSDFMNEISAALQFFDGFGENWYALEECLSYLDEWLPADGYILVVERAEELLSREPLEALSAFFKSVDSAGCSWSQPIHDNDRFDREAKPFHVLLIVSDPIPQNQTRLLEAAHVAGVEVRVDQ